MTQVLYRKYRPTNFDEIVGQKHVVNVLMQQIKTDQIGHAYLFTGPRGTGKTTTARLFSKSINNIDDSNDTTVLDIVEIDAASNRGIDEIRDLKERINFAPNELRYKVYVIDEVHMLTKEAFNALLKTIEEPPEHVVFIFATTEPHKVPLTILSRVVRFDFKLGTDEEIEEKIKVILKNEKISIDQDALKILVRQGRGSFRDTESLLGKILTSTESKKVTLKDIEDVLGFTSYEYVIEFLDAVNNKHLENAFEVMLKVQDEGKSVVQFAYQVLEESRVILSDVINKKRNDWSLRDLGMLIKQFSNAISESKTSLIPMLPFEIAILNSLETNDNVIVRKEQVKSVGKTPVKPFVTKKDPVKKADDKSKKETVVKESVPKTETKDVPKKKKAKSSFNLTVEMIDRDWDKLLESIKDHNHHLTAFLMKSKPVEVKEDVIILHAPFEFHKKKLEDLKSKERILLIMRELWHEDVNYSVEVNKSMVPKKEVEEDTEVDNTNKNIVEEIFDF